MGQDSRIIRPRANPLTRGLPWQAMVARGDVPGASIVRKFGRNSLVGTVKEAVWSVGGLYTGWLTTASTVRVKAGGHANDTAAGTGARTIRVEGLDENFAEAGELITLAGASASAATTTTFIRVFRAYGVTCGTYHGTNAGDIDIEDTGTSSVLARIGTAVGQSQLAIYTVPAGKTAFLMAVDAHVEGNKQALVNLCQARRADIVAAPFESIQRLVLEMPGLIGEHGNNLQAWGACEEMSDLWFEATASTGTVVVTASMDLLLIDD